MVGGGAGGGGGSSDIRLSTNTTLAGRLLIGGGGGGGGTQSTTETGGTGGGTAGGAGSGPSPGQGGTQTAGGAAGQVQQPVHWVLVALVLLVAPLILSLEMLEAVAVVGSMVVAVVVCNLAVVEVAGAAAQMSLYRRMVWNHWTEKLFFPTYSILSSCSRKQDLGV